MLARPRPSSLLVQALIVVAVVVAGLWAMGFHTPRQPAIGLLGCFSECSGAAVACRDGVMTAVDEYNATRGGASPEVRLIVRDARGDAASHVREMINSGAMAIIGPTCGNCLRSARAAADRWNIVMMSPVLADEAPAEHATSLISIYPKIARRYEFVARHLHGRRQIREIAVFTGNDGAAAGRMFADIFEEIDGENRCTTYMVSPGEQVLKRLADSITREEPGAVLLLATPVENGILAQHLRQGGFRGLLITDEFLLTREFIAFGGAAVEGTLLFSTFQFEHASDRYRSFRDRFVRRFGYEPNAAAVHSYDATRIVLSSFSETQRPDDLRELLLAKQTYAGLQERIVLSRNGDIRREIYPVTLQQGRFTPSK